MLGKSLRIIYVEGHENLSEVIELALIKMGGFETYGFGNADEALEGAVVIQPDAILVDAAHVNGLASYFLKELRMLDGCRDIPVVLASDRRGVHQIRRYKALGATVVIPTPINPFSLSETILAACSGAAPVDVIPTEADVPDRAAASG